MNDIRHLTCLSAVKAMNGIRQLTPAAFPGNHCPMHTALSLGSRIKGVSTLVIGTAECGYYSRNVPLTSPYPDQGLHWTYVLDSKEVVFGFRDGLIQAVREMDEAGAKVILLLATCVPELVGEDIESICFEIQPFTKARLLHIPLGNFKCGSYQPGYWKTLLAMGMLMERVMEKSKTVNVLGRSRSEDHIPTPQLIEKLEQKGIFLRFLAPDACLEDFTAAGDAQLNLVLSPFMDPLAQWMSKEHGIPFFSLHDVYDIFEIETMYSSIEQMLEIELGFEEQLAQGKSAQSQAAKQVAGLHYIGTQVGGIQPLPLAAYLSSLEMTPIMIHMEEFYPSDKLWRDRLLHLDKNPIICMMVNEQADKVVIDSLCPDLIIGGWGAIPILDLYGQVGCERTIALLERITKALPNKREV